MLSHMISELYNGKIYEQEETEDLAMVRFIYFLAIAQFDSY